MNKKILSALLALFMVMGSLATFSAPVHGKNQETNLHPYALALRDYLKELEQRGGYNGYIPDAYLEDINGDGIKEMLVGWERLYYLHNGKLYTYDIEADFGNADYGLEFTYNNHLVAQPRMGDAEATVVLKLKEGKIIQETEFVAVYVPGYIGFTHDDRKIPESEYKRLNEMYSGAGAYYRENQFDEILAMTNPVKIMATSSKVQVNGSPRELEAYSIDGNNYFKLRDLAQVVNNTEKNFEVAWDGTNKVINLKSNTTYTPAGGELAKGGNSPKDANPSASKIYKDGVEVNLTAYNIKGSNFFKLRDIAEAFDIGVTWNKATKTIGIDTSIGYVID